MGGTLDQLYRLVPMETQRRFIKRGIFGGALLTLGSGGGLLALRHSTLVDPPPEGLEVLGHREYSTLDAISRRMLPPRAGWPSVGEVRVAFRCDRALSLTDETSQV